MVMSLKPLVRVWSKFDPKAAIPAKPDRSACGTFPVMPGRSPTPLTPGLTAAGLAPIGRPLPSINGVFKMNDRAERPAAPLKTPTDLGSNARHDISGALNAALADAFALYLKTK